MPILTSRHDLILQQGFKGYHSICLPILTLRHALQVNSETDFVARNDKFMGLVSAAAQAALKSSAGRTLLTSIQAMVQLGS